MDDEYILNKGGDEYDIEQFAKQHGADLTKEDCLREDFLKIAHTVMPISNQQAIQYADYWLKVISDERERLINELEESRMPMETKEWVINLIKNNE